MSSQKGIKVKYRRSVSPIWLVSFFGLPAAAILSVVLAVWAEADAAGPETTASKTTGYLPSISDLMISTIQPRHIRLWLAVQNNNWDFAGYEMHNLMGAFHRVGEAHPTEHDISMQDMIMSVTEQPFADLDKAIKSKDPTAFATAYGNLTAGCNACHQATNHGVVVIRVPREASAPDLDFSLTAQ